MAVTDIDRRILWVRAGGRCTLCKTYLLEGELSAKEVPLGEGAHIVGQVDSERSARGKDPMPIDDRDDVDNIMLACSRCHTEIDKQRVAHLLDVDLLRNKKREHEADIKMQTGLLRDRRTAILRIGGSIRGDVMELPRQAAAEAVIRCAERFPHFVESYDRQGIEIDLFAVDGEQPLREGYYAAATAKIDTAWENRILPGIKNGDITHLSVFAIARLPLLVYLGAKIDDGIAADIYQRHRSSDTWMWPANGSAATFTVTSADATAGRSDAVLITNISGTTPPGDLPTDLQSAPRWTIEPDAGPAEDAFSSAHTLFQFEEAVRRFFTDLEATHKPVTAVHLFGALPLAGAVAFGRVLKSRGLRPAVITYDYDRAHGGYQRALEI